MIDKPLMGILEVAVEDQSPQKAEIRADDLVTVGTTDDCDVQIKVEEDHPARFFVIEAKGHDFYIKDLTREHIYEYLINPGIPYNLRTPAGAVSVKLSSLASPSPLLPLDDSAPGPTEGGGEDMPDRRTPPFGADATLADDWLIDLAPIAATKLLEIFGAGVMALDEAKERLWRYILDHADVKISRQPTGTDASWMTPLESEIPEADEDVEPKYALGTTETIETYSIAFRKVRSLKLVEVFSSLQLTNRQLFDEFENFLRGKGILRQTQ